MGRCRALQAGRLRSPPEPPLKLDSYAQLPFASRQHLLQRAERKIGIRGRGLDGRRILPIEYIEELEQHLQSRTLTQIEALAEAHVEVHVVGRGESITTPCQIDAVERAIAVRIDVGSGAAVVKPALCAKDAAQLYLPRQFKQAVELKSVSQR